MRLPPAFYLNSRTDSGKRNEFEWRLEQAGLKARRFPVPAAADLERILAGRRKKGRSVPKWARDGQPVTNHTLTPPPGIPSQDEGEDAPKTAPPRRAQIVAYAWTLGFLLLLRQARRERLDAVLVLNDGAAFHPNFRQLVDVVAPPEDWELFHLGHTFLDEAPEPVAAGVVRVQRGSGFNGFIVRAEAIRTLVRALRRQARQAEPGMIPEVALATAQESLRTYACFPNLIWLDPNAHLREQAGKAGYGLGGTQTVEPEIASRLFQSMFASGRAAEIPEPAAGRTRLALLFLTKGDTHHPKIWREYVAQAPEHVKIFCHPKDQLLPKGSFLDGTVINERHQTAWGDVSLVRATLSLLRAALADPNLTHFALLSESCVPVKSLPEVLRLLDWNPRSRFDWRELTNASATERRRALDLPEVPAACWRFQSQWWLLERNAAEWVARVDYTDVFARMQVPDEGYFSTVLCLLGFPLADFVERKVSTWTRWEGGPHPVSHDRLSPADLRSILESGALFARKFPETADVGRFGLHRHGGA
jgi:hypothetical protein